MEPKFGADFSAVQVHTGARAAQSARSVNALAYTVGEHIVFGDGQFSSHTEAGRRIIAHELTHVVQQSQGAVNVSSTADGGVSVSEPSDPLEREADLTASEVISAKDGPGQSRPRMSPTITARRPDHGAALVQRFGGAAVPAATDCTVLPADSALTGERFQYEFADTRLRPGEAARIRALAATLSADEALEIHGFASWEGNPAQAALNRDLSCARADAFRDELLALGIPASQLASERFAHGADPASTLPPEDQRAVVLRRRRKTSPEPEPEPTPPSPPTRSCGPDISRQLTIVLSDIQRAFADPSVPEWKRELACDNLVTPTPAAIMGWDIIDLFLPHTGWLRTGRCGVPIINTEDPAGCGNTVEVDGACHLAGTVNYSMYGIACRLCSDRHRKVLPVGLDSWTLGDMKFWVGFYNVADTTGGGIGPPTDWAVATYLGGPTGRPTSANRSSCPVVGCATAHSSFDFAWPPIRGSLDH